MNKSKRTQGASGIAKGSIKKVKFGLSNAESSDLKGINSLFSQKKKEPRTHFSKKKTSVKTHLKTNKKKPVTQFGGSYTRTEEDDSEEEAQTTLLAENYTQNYLKKKQEKVGSKDQANPIDKKKEVENEIEKQKDVQQRSRAQWLQEQIFTWKRKLNTGEFEDTVIHANITIYEREFYSIDQRYRP